MNQKIDCFIAYSGQQETQNTINLLRKSQVVQSIFVLSASPVQLEGSQNLTISQPQSTATINLIAANLNADYALLGLQATQLGLGQWALERMMQLAEGSKAAMPLC